MWMSRLLSSAASMMSSAQTRLARSSSTCWPRTTIRCRSSRWNSWSPKGSAGASATRATMGASHSSGAGVVTMPSSLSMCSVVSAMSLSVTITRCQGPEVRCRGLFAVGAGFQPVTTAGRARGPLLGFPRVFPGLVGFVVGFVVGLGIRGGDRCLDVHRAARLVGDRGALGDQRERLAAQHVGGDRGELATLGQLLGQAVRGDAHPVRLLGAVSGQFVLVYAELLLGRQLVQNEPGLDAAPRVLGELRVELLGRLVGGLEVLVHRVPGAFQPVSQGPPARRDLAVHEILGQRDVDP